MSSLANSMTAPAAAAGQRPAALAGLELLASAVLLLDADGRIAYANAAAENLLESSLKALSRQTLSAQFLNPAVLDQVCAQAREHRYADMPKDLMLERVGREALHVHSIVTALDEPAGHLLIELREHLQHLKLDREERILDQSQVNKELDRLQTLGDRLLAPHRRPHIVGDVNIHEVLERVRSLMLAEFPSGLTIRRDYDASIPEFRGDKEQLIQTVLNIAHNAAQALAARIEAGDAEIIFKTRVARQVTLAKVRYG